MTLSSITLLLMIGLVSGIASGLFGIGGGLLIVPGLIYLAGFSQHAATGTSLAVLLPPVGLAAVIEYYRHGNVDFKAALIMAAGLFVGGWFCRYRQPTGRALFTASIWNLCRRPGRISDIRRLAALVLAMTSKAIPTSDR